MAQVTLASMRSHDRGRRSEQLACDYLAARGWTIVNRNYRAGPKEIDVVARRHQTVAFVEVKARFEGSGCHPLHAVTWAKRRELACAARHWIGRFARPGDEYRFDVVAVLWRGQAFDLEHLEDAWRVR